MILWVDRLALGANSPDHASMSLFAPDGGYSVRIIDHSAPHDDNIVEEIGGFTTLAHANEFARRYVRASLESCREPGMSAEEVISAWMTFGEDASVPEAAEHGFTGQDEVALFARHPAESDDLNWRILDPRS